MNKNITRAGFGAVVALCALSLPVQAATILTFNTSGTGGTINTTGGTGGTLATNGIDITNFTGITVAGAPNDDVTWSLTSGAFTYNTTGKDYQLTGTLTCTGCGSGGSNLTVTGNSANPLIQINVSAQPTATFPLNTEAKVLIQNVTSITEAATFLTDLGLTPPSGEYIAAGSFVEGSGSACTGSNNCSFTDFSNSLQITMTPEPYTFALLGSGLMLVALIGRRKVQRPQAAPVKI